MHPNIPLIELFHLRKRRPHPQQNKQIDCGAGNCPDAMMPINTPTAETRECERECVCFGNHNNNSTGDVPFRGARFAPRVTDL